MLYKELILNERLCTDIINFYLKPESLFATANYFNIGRKVLKKLLIYKNVQLHSKEVNKKIIGSKHFLPAVLQNLSLCNNVIDFYKKPNSFKATCKEFNLSVSTLNFILKRFNIQRHPQNVFYALRTNETKKVNKERYGVESTSCLEAVQEKARQTTLSHFGVEYPAQNKQIYNKMKNTMLDRYGVDNISKLDVVKQEKAEHSKKTCQKKYSCDYVFQSENFKLKSKAAIEEKYDVDNYAKTEDFLKKSYATKKINNSFNVSKSEDELYNKLCNIFNKDSVFRQYNTKIFEKSDRYPFDCDFYIKPLDLFIELNFSWTHGGHVFDANCEKDLETLDHWRDKALISDYYKNAINVWTVRDPLKLKTADKNKLKYCILYTISDENKLLESLVKV